MDDSSSGGEGPAPAERLREPLLRQAQGSPEAVDVEVWTFSREWAEFDDSSGEEHGRAGPSRFRQEARGGAPARSPNWPNGPASPGPLVPANGGEQGELEVFCFGSRVRGALVCCFYFVENNLLAVCAALAFWERDCVALACLGPPWSLLVFFEIWLASNDRSVTATVQKLRRQGAYLRLAVVQAFVVVVLGCFFGYLLFRARRHWIQKGQRSFVAELEGLGSTPQVDATRLDTLVMFLTSVPAVVGLSCSLADSYGTHEPLALKVFAVFLAMCTADLAIAITEFDYCVSRHIRQRYDMYFDGEDWFQSSRRDALRFQKLHCCSRLAELLGRMLVLMAGAIASTAYPGLAAAAAGADFLFGVAVLACVSGLSGKVVLIGVPLFLVDIAHYVDEPGFAPSAQKLSRLCSQLHACEIALAIAVYIGCGIGKFPSWRAAPWGPCLPAAMGCATVVFYTAHFLLRWLVAAPSFPGELYGSPGGPPTQFQDLQALFGQEIGIGSVPRKRRRLVSFLFWGGFGEQLEHLREQLDAHSRGSQVRLSNLKNLGKLGAGGFGKVFKVKDAVSGNVYALKLQLKDKAAKCAIREAQALHKSEHAFIVRLVHVFQTKELYGILMEFCATDLNRHILASTSEPDGRLGAAATPGKAEGLPEAKAERYTICMMLALEHLHGKGIVFRDLKPENVLLTAPEEGDHAKLTDFGLAKPLERALPGNGDSSPIFISPGAGTPAFMAREAFQKVQSLDAAVTGAVQEESGLPKWVASRDWYALGCCLLLMLLGEHGGRRASAGGREVLLPPPDSDIPAALRMAARRRRISAEAFHLVASLTAPEISERAGAAEVRQCGWLAGSAQLLELEAVAADEGPRSRVGT